MDICGREDLQRNLAVLLLRNENTVDLSYAEMGIYPDNSSAIVIDDNFLPIVVITQNSFDLSITYIAFVIYFVIADKLSR